MPSSKIHNPPVDLSGVGAKSPMKLAAVVVDWAGTIIDHGSCAPVEALQRIFSDAGCPIGIDEARSPMGLAKKSHIEAILSVPRVRSLWEHKRGALPSAADVEALYAEFIPRQLDSLRNNSRLVEGAAEALARFRSRGLVIGSTTGYTRPMLDYLLTRAAEQGLVPDCALCSDDVPAGRPAPWMCYGNAMRLNVYPMWLMVKIGDTPVDVEEGLNAGMWTIGVTRTGNEVGLSEQEWHMCSAVEKNAKLAVAEEKLRSAGAHYTAESVADCFRILEQIDTRISQGETPGHLHAAKSGRHG